MKNALPFTSLFNLWYMKKILLPILACGMFAGVFAQPGTLVSKNSDSTEKWVITRVYAKSITGKLFFDLPNNALRDLKIYAAGSDKVIASSKLKTTFDLTPGRYDLETDHIWIKGVPVEKGNNTRIKAGVLQVTAFGSWKLYDESKETVLINTSNPQSRGLPVGKYKLTIGWQVEDIEIKDGSIVQANKENPESDYWVITPLAAMTSGIGKLNIIVPQDTTIYISQLNKWVTFPYLIRDTVKIIESGSTHKIIELPKYLYARTYQLSLNNIRISNVPVTAGKETRIKAGFLAITKKESDGGGFDGYVFDQLDGSDDITWEWQLCKGRHLSGNQYYDNVIASGKKGRIFALPPGEYKLKKINPNYTKEDAVYKVFIKDGEWVTNGVRQ